jgi:hypothetical protein
VGRAWRVTDIMLRGVASSDCDMRVPNIHQAFNTFSTFFLNFSRDDKRILVVCVLCSCIISIKYVLHR